MVAIREAFVWPATVGLRREVRVRVRMRSLVKIGFGRFNEWRVGVEIARVRRDDVEQQTMSIGISGGVDVYWPTYSFSACSFFIFAFAVSSWRWYSSCLLEGRLRV